MANAVNAVGVLLEAAGLLIAAVGLVDTWRQYGPPGEPLTAPLRRRWAAASTGAKQRWERGWRWLLRKPRPIVIHSGTVAINLGTPQVTVRGRKGYGPLPEEPGAAIRMLGERTDELLERVQNARDATDDAVEALKGELAVVVQRLDSAVAELEVQTRRVASGGVRLQLVGFSAVGVGLALQLISPIFGAG